MKTINFEELLNPMPVMVKSINLKIDGDMHYGTPLTKEEFIGKFYELETLICTDDKMYWVLYEERFPEHPWCEEIFWYIPKEEIHFIYEEEHGWNIFEYRKSVEEYNQTLEKYNQFESNLACYILFDKCEDEDVYKFWLNLRKLVDISDDDVSNNNKVCLITYLETYWNAWLECIMDKTYKYMNCTRMVWESWEEN